MTVLAHSGGIGWDEALFLVLPVVVLLVLLRQARRNAPDAGGDQKPVAGSTDPDAEEG